MRIKDLLQRDKITVSCEIFPPKKENGFDNVIQVADRICQLGADFVSVTYGAGGSTSKKTVDIASHIQNEMHTPALAHMTCVASRKEDIKNRLAEMKANGIENILALRGDKPKGFTGEDGDYKYAIELIRDIRSQGNFCIGGACYPEGHIECEHKETDIGFLKEKVDAGCDFLTTQMFFDNNVYYNFRYRVLAAGITVPVIPGIMPVINARQIKRSCELSNTRLPPRFQAIADKFSDDPLAMEQAGVAYATEQIIDLIANGVKYIHIYTMNRPETAEKIFQNLSYILR